MGYDDTIYSTFGRRIKLLRTENHLTQRETAEKIGVTAASLSAYENGTQSPSIEVALKTACAFGESLDWLCGLTKDSERSVRNKSIRATLNGLILLCNTGAITLEIKTDGESEWLGGLNVSSTIKEFLTIYNQTTNLHKSGLLSDDSYFSIQRASVDSTAKAIIDQYFSGTDSQIDK